MVRRNILPALVLFLCLMVDSSHEKRTHSEKPSPTPTWGKRNTGSETGVFSEREMVQLSSRPHHSDDKARKRRLPTSIADKINTLSMDNASPTTERSDRDFLRLNILPKESEQVVFSRKYSPRVGSDSDGFVPVPGPYGMKTSYDAREKTPVGNAYHQSGPVPSNANAVSKRARAKNHVPRQATINIAIHPQSMQRRAQYRSPKVHDELAVKESIANENILGNGNFEIIRGGIFSDQDRNEILGSRRISRGFGNYPSPPTYRQNENRLNSVQNVQFPPLYQRQVQNPVHPFFFPRAPY